MMRTTRTQPPGRATTRRREAPDRGRLFFFSLAAVQRAPRCLQAGPTAPRPGAGYARKRGLWHRPIPWPPRAAAALVCRGRRRGSARRKRRSLGPADPRELANSSLSLTFFFFFEI